MKRALLAALVLSGCSGDTADLNEIELNRAAAELSQKADLAADDQINEMIAEEEPAQPAEKEKK